MARRRTPRRRRPQIHTTDEAAGMALRRSLRPLSQIRTSEDVSGIALRRSPRLHPQIPVSGEGAGVTRRRSSRLNPQIRVAEEGTGVALHRSPRLHPQLHTSEEGAGVTRRRSPRLHPEVHASEEGAGVTRRRSPRLHPEVHASEEGAGVPRRRRRRGTSLETPASLPDDDDMLREILMRLPPQPSSLPRVSAVCKRWQRVAADPRFLRSFSAHHRKPPLLGVFERDGYSIVYTPVLNPPNRIPPERFDTRGQIRGYRKADLLACRHGRVLLMETDWLVVWDPITGEHRRVEIPPAFDELSYFYGAVLCTDADQGHTHGSCHWSPFKVVLMSPCKSYNDNSPPIACVYSSETGVWGNDISTEDRCAFIHCNPGILVGNILYWTSKSVKAGSHYMDLDELGDDIIEFDLDRQSLAVIKGPPGLNYSTTHQIFQAEDGDVGLAILSHGIFEMWQRKVSCQGGATWLPQKTVELRTVLALPPQIEGSVKGVEILGYDEDNDVMFVFVDGIVYTVQVMSMQSTKLYESSCCSYANDIHAFTSFYAPAIPAGRNGAGMLQDTKDDCLVSCGNILI